MISKAKERDSSFLATLLLGALVFAHDGRDGSRAGNFKVIGPGGGGAMFHPIVSPHDLNTVLLSCDMTGAYITHDGGKSWRMFNLRGVVRFFVFDPQDQNVIYAETVGLWRSTDSGGSWNLVYPKPSSIKGVKMSSDHSDEEIIADASPPGSITAMAIDPADSRVLYVTASDRKEGTSALFVSRDRGQSWGKVAELPETANRVWVRGAHREMRERFSCPVHISSPRKPLPGSKKFLCRARRSLWISRWDSAWTDDRSFM